MVFIFIFILAIILTIFLVFLILNLKSPGKRIEHKINPAGDLSSASVIRSIGQLLGPPLVGGNKVDSLQNGDQIFFSMLEEIKKAKRTITFETFIYWSGDIGKQFANCLIERAKAGVRIHVILDWLGSRSFDDVIIEKMLEAGIQIVRYRPIRWYNISRLNNRTHRKILVIDGIVGFTGGVGIADQWKGNAQDEYHWRDSHFKISGPVVSQLQAAFMDNWNATHPEVLHGENYFPEITSVGNVLAQVFKSSPEEGSGSVRLMYLYSIAHAKKSIQIANSYLVPDTHVRKLLIEAAKRGVKIEIIVPGKIIDTAITRRASRSVWGELLLAGIEINEYEETMFHCKYMIVDDLWVSVGSTNLDNRSFRLNDECNLNALDSEWALHMKEIFYQDKARSNFLTWEKWNGRPIWEKICDQFASLFRSQL